MPPKKGAGAREPTEAELNALVHKLLKSSCPAAAKAFKKTESVVIDAAAAQILFDGKGLADLLSTALQAKAKLSPAAKPKKSPAAKPKKSPAAKPKSPAAKPKSPAAKPKSPAAKPAAKKAAAKKKAEEEDSSSSSDSDSDSSSDSSDSSSEDTKAKKSPQIKATKPAAKAAKKRKRSAQRDTEQDRAKEEVWDDGTGWNEEGRTRHWKPGGTGRSAAGAVDHFCRIDVSKVKFANTQLRDNRYETLRDEGTMEEEFSYKAHCDLIKTQGKDFTKAKNKKKKANYRAGVIDQLTQRSYQFSDSE